MDVFTCTNYVTSHDRNWYDNEDASDNTTKDMEPFNINPLKEILPRLKYRCLISVFVWRVSCIVKGLKQNPAEPASEGHSVLFVGLPVAVFVLM